MSSPASSFNSMLTDAKSGNISGLLAKHSDVLFPIVVLLALTFLLFPMPTQLLSILVVVNIGLSMVILITSLYINSPVQLTSYPTILLLSTIFRLTLSVSATGNILQNGQAGAVIEALGHVTAQGDVIIGAVKFIVIMAVMFIVVAKGAERVSEVAARFTLDAMPGKQMAIDADLRSGLISQEEARKQRNELQKESQLHGAMDGAMKFVKGDAIATIIIALVNIIAGLLIGVLRKGMDLGVAAEKYTILTFGDGLAAIISSLLVTVSAGIVVTRVSASDEKTSPGADIQAQLFKNPKPLMITGALFMPMFFLSIFFPIVGAGIGGLGLYLYRKNNQTKDNSSNDGNVFVPGADGEDDLQPSFTVPLTIVVSREITPFIDAKTPSGAVFQQELPKLRSAMYYDLGVLLPQCHVSGDAPLKENQYFIALKEVPVGIGTLRPECVYVNDSADNIRVFGLEGENVLNPADLRPGSWIPIEQRPIAEAAGLKIWEAREVITLHLSRVLRKHAYEFVGIQEAQGYLDFAARGVPKLVEEVVGNGKIITIHQFTDVLQRLVQEGISIRDIKTILDALSEWGRIEKDTVMLTEYVRSSLKRYISFKYTAGKDTLFVYLLDPEIEDVIRGSIRRTSTGSFLSLDPAITHDILDAIRREISNLPATAQQPVVVTDMELRRFVRKMVELEFPTLAVLSYQELTPELNVQPLGRIAMRPSNYQSSFSDFGQLDDEFNEFPEMLED
ncbi:MAG: type III secretion system export apparatus subunit SctV [Pyrinomonadaceae bacterium]|nr:type III secretion system export apparatus subunit SctV [Pyrinomonadaceae bacterium]